MSNLDKKDMHSVNAVKDEIPNQRVKDILELRGVFKTKKRIPFRKIRKAFEEYLARRHLRNEDI